MINTIIRDSNDRLNESIQEKIDHDLQHKEKKKKGWYNEGSARAKMIQRAKPEDFIDIWCRTCKKDYKGLGVKIVFDAEYWQGNGLVRAWYAAKCRKGHECIRHITDKHLDPYFKESVLLNKELKQMAYEDDRAS